jgi:uncharacterized membrane protein
MHSHAREHFARSRALPHVVPALVMAAVLIAAYLTMMLVPSGLGSYILSLIALVIIAITALARVNDIAVEQVAMRWQVRRLGLILACAGALSLALVPIFSADWPTWRDMAFYWGIALTWITTPHMPPWARYITGHFRTVHEAKLAAVAPMVSGLDPKDDAPQYAQADVLPPGVLTDRRTATDEECGP